MKILHLAFLASALLPLPGFLHAEEQSIGIPVRVNGKPIVSSEVRDAVQAQEHFIRLQTKDPDVARARILEVRASALFTLMERQLVLSEFEQARGSLKPRYVEDEIHNLIREKFGGDRKKFLHELANADMTLSGFREEREKMMIVTALRSQIVKNLPPPTPAQVEAFYRKHADKFRDKDYVKFSTITIPMHAVGDAAATPGSQKKLASEIRSQITSAADFAQMARTHSTDACAQSGGDRGLQERSELNTEIASVVFGLKNGAVSPVVEIGDSYMILLCEAKQPGKLEPLDKLRPQIEKAVAGELARDAVNRWLSGLASKAIIQPESVKRDFLAWIGRHQGAVE
jgi:peptidyl-prolyl cis-trans isomerase SurA